ncbi:hypothetical protein [Gramella sp. KN1008]|uniref:hypothetical protein n=1 Tax=Gramella sp. KN1008 TaxID=2529298 RepID=UPI001040BC67|nr:hypothetical protein [Gramella sp. KN1008]TBW26408.1 hypothetical protein EZJ28_14490 [Gramella sp. KN1008]
MWEPAIAAIQNDDSEWIRSNHLKFRNFFKDQNLLEKGKLNEEALQEHYKARLFKMFIESSLGGLELDLKTGAKWIENASQLDGNWGWLLAIGVGGGYFSQYLSENLRQKYFKPVEALVAGSGKPDGNAEPSRQLYNVNGSWDYCSGSEQASLFTAVIDKEGETAAVILPKDQVEIVRNWNAVGLELTCSHRIVARNVFLPEENFFHLSHTPKTFEYPLGSYPFDLFARVCFAPVVLGITRSLWYEISNITREKMPVWKKFQPQKYHKVEHLLSDFQKELQLDSAKFYEVVGNSWQGHIKNRDLRKKKLQKISIDLSKYCYRKTSQIIPLLGMDVINRDHPVQECWRDLQTAYQHMVFRDY